MDVLLLLKINIQTAETVFFFSFNKL
jgi:hypothetical protein